MSAIESLCCEAFPSVDIPGAPTVPYQLLEGTCLPAQSAWGLCYSSQIYTCRDQTQQWA